MKLHARGILSKSTVLVLLAFAVSLVAAGMAMSPNAAHAASLSSGKALYAVPADGAALDAPFEGETAKAVQQDTLSTESYPAFKLNATSFTFSKKTAVYWTFTVCAADDSGYSQQNRIVKAKNSKPSVASAKLYKGTDYTTGYVVVTPKKAGTTKVTCTDQLGRTKTITIKVKANYFNANLKQGMYAASYYGSKKATVYTRPSAKVTLKIGSEKYTKKANKQGVVSFKLKKAYKLNTKYTVTAKTAKAKASKSFKTSSNTWMTQNGSIWSCKYYFPVKVSNAHKGDKIVLKLGSRTYSHKVTYTPRSGSYYYYTFYSSYKMGNYTSAKMYVYNKYGQRLYYTKDTWRWR